MATQFKKTIQQQSYPYTVKSISAEQFTQTNCQVVYFSTTPPKQQQQLIQAYPSQALLSVSSNDPLCEIGSIFCLYNKDNTHSFQINLDILSTSTVHIDPRVLLLAKNKE